MGAALLAPLMHAAVSMYCLGLLASCIVLKAWGGLYQVSQGGGGGECP